MNDDTEADDDTPATDDQYKRKNTAAPFEELLRGMRIDFTPYSPEWWADREKKIADEQARAVAETEARRLHARAEDLKHRGGFPEMFIEAALKATLDTDALRFACIFPKLPSRFAVFAGGVGSGKTTAATWLGLRGNDHDPGFIRASELERRGRYDKTLDAWLKERTSLVVDDLGVEILDSKRIFASLLDEIVDMFYAKKRTLVMTTNLLPRITDEMRAEAKLEGREPEPQFTERYGDRVRSRVKQIGQWCDCGVTDLRGEMLS